MNKVEKIKAEIERLKSELIQEAKKGYKSEFDEGRISAFEDMIVYINSLSDTEKDFGIKSSDLEEAAHSYVDTAIECFDSEGNPCCYPAFIAGAQWQKERDQSTIELAEDHAYLAGQEKIIAKACEWLENYFKGVSSGTVYLEDFKKAIKE